jgi:VanZ family protein
MFIYWLSAHSTLKPPIDFNILYQDKLYHAGAYFMMGLLAWRALKHFIHGSIALTVASIAFCSVYGISDEWHQSFVVGRSTDIFDWLADTVGASVANILLRHPLFSTNKVISTKEYPPMEF